MPRHSSRHASAMLRSFLGLPRFRPPLTLALYVLRCIDRMIALLPVEKLASFTTLPDGIVSSQLYLMIRHC